MNKQNLWFITLFSIILILSIYYISMPSSLLEEFDNFNAATNQNDSTSLVINESTALVSLRIEDDEAVLNEINNLQNIMLNNESSIDEKNAAYESLKNINEIQSKEEEIEKLLKDEFSYDSFVKLSKDQVNIVISGTEHNKQIANNIMNKVQSLFTSKKYITIKFQ